MKLHYLYFTFLIFSLMSSAANAQDSSKVIRVSGAVTHPLTLSAEDLSKMNRVTAVLKNHSGKDESYTGVSLAEILKIAGAPMGSELRGKNLAKFLLVKSADGYQVVFALAELDEGFTDKVVILADQSDGKLLPETIGPFRIIVPGEKRAARSSFKVTQLIVMTAGE